MDAQAYETWCRATAVAALWPAAALIRHAEAPTARTTVTALRAADTIACLWLVGSTACPTPAPVR